MASMTDVMTELADMESLMVSDLTSDAVKEGILATLCSKASVVSSLSTAEAARVYSALSASPMNMEHKLRLQQSVEARMLMHTSTGKEIATLSNWYGTLCTSKSLLSCTTHWCMSCGEGQLPDCVSTA